MPPYIALLRAGNVGGTGQFTMRDLRSLCEAVGFGNGRTYIASGNVVASPPRRRAQEQVTRDCPGGQRASACFRSSCSKALAIRVISADRAPTSLATVRHVDVAAATSLMIPRACGSPRAK